MGKTIVLNLNHINIKGDVLDVGESFGVIYNIAKDIDDEVSVDYIEEENSELLKERSYDNCTIFFALSNIWGDYQREKLLQKISRSIKSGGSIYIWDINKEIGKLFNNKIRVILPSEKIKEFQFKNLNPMSLILKKKRYGKIFITLKQEKMKILLITINCNMEILDY